MTREDSERAYIEAVLHDNSILASSQLTSEMFTSFRGVFDNLVDIASKGRVTLGHLLRGVSEADAALVQTLQPFTASLWERSHAAILEAWGLETLHTAAKVAMRQDYAGALETFEKASLAVSSRETVGKTVRLVDLVLPALERVSAGGNTKGVPWGFQAIDQATLGARPGHLVVIGARPSQGKSALMAQLIRNMASETRLGVVTIESDQEELTMRLLAGEASVDSRLLSTGVAATANRTALARGGQRLAEIGANVLIHDRPGIRIRQLESVARRMAVDGIKVLFVDYLQLVRCPGKDTKREEVAEVSTRLKGIARELKLCVVALAQLSRDSDGKRPTMGECQHSSQIEQDADQVWLIHHDRNKDTGEITKSRIILDKVRDGQTRDVVVTFSKPTLSFYEVVA